MRRDEGRNEEKTTNEERRGDVRFVNVRGKIIIIYIQRRFSRKPSLKCSRYLHNCHYYTNENGFLTTVVEKSFFSCEERSDEHKLRLSQSYILNTCLNCTKEKWTSL